jgi:hypothetical protein
VSSGILRNTLRGAYGRGVAKVPVVVPRTGLEMVPLRPSREIVAATAPLYLAAAIPLSLVFLLSVLVVSSEAPRPSTVVVTEFEEPPIAKMVAETPPPPLEEPEVAKRETPPAPQVEQAELAAAPVPAAVPIEIEIDAIDPVRNAPATRAPATRLAAVRVPKGQATRPSDDVRLTASDSFELARATEAPLPRATPDLPSVSMAGSGDRPDVEVAKAGAPAGYDEGFDEATAQPVASVPEAADTGRGGLGFEPVARSGGSPPGRSLAGVPLESLAPCESLAREDELKQTLLRDVVAGRECADRDGTYRFIETRNVNAFSMGVRETSSRALGNRCEELERAIACVDNQRNGRVQP